MVGKVNWKKVKEHLLLEALRQKSFKKTIEIAKRQPESSIRIHKTDGKIQEERTYPKKSDPYPPRG